MSSSSPPPPPITTTSIHNITSRDHSEASSSWASSEQDTWWQTPDEQHQQQQILIITHASYQSLRNPKPWRTRFVTETLKDWVEIKGKQSRLQLDGEFNHRFGDPCPGELKDLLVRFQVVDAYSNKVLLKRQVRWIEGAKRVFGLDAKKLYKSIKPKSPRATIPSTSVITASTVIIPSPFLFPHSALSIIASFLPVYPDRLNCRLVCKTWQNELTESGLTTEFRIGGDYFPLLPNYIRLPPSFVEMIVNKSSASLRTLDLSGYAALSDDHFIHITANAPQLRDLNLTDCNQLTDLSLSLLGTRCTFLISLTIKRVRLVTDDAMVNIARGCTMLQRLDASECDQITDASLVAMAMNLTCLRALFLRESHLVTDMGGLAILRGLSTLREVSLCGMHRLTNASFQEGVGMFKLRSVTLEGCHGIADDALAPLATSCPLLLSLNVKYCHRFTERGLDYLSKFAKLQHLNLCYVKNVTDGTLRKLARDNIELRSIDLSHCFRITNAGMAALASSLQWISEFRLCSCLQFTCDTVKVLVNGIAGMKLAMLDMRDCDNIVVEECLKELRERVDVSFVSDCDEVKCFFRMPVG